jgi:hypothetical protein
MQERSISDLRQYSAELRAGALELIERSGIRKVVAATLGQLEVVGSVDLDLMVWRDIDLYARAGPEESSRFVGLLTEICAGLSRAGHLMVKASFNNEYRRPGNPYGHGLYLGLLVLLNGEVPEWKIDLWAWNEATYPQKMAEHARLAEALKQADRDLILRIKQAVHSRREYRNTITSLDVYAFALAGAGTTVDDFDEFVRNRQVAAAISLANRGSGSHSVL